VKLDHCDRRLGDEELGGDEMDADSLYNFRRSVEPKLRQAGVKGGVDSPGWDGRMIVFLHFSHIPEADVMPPLQVLHIATVVEAVESEHP
jgi:hypothetical protein